MLVLPLLASSLLGLVIYMWLGTLRYRHLPADFGTPFFGYLYHCFNYLKTGGVKYALGRIASLMDRYGDVVCFFMGPFPMVAVADPAIMQELSFHPAFANKEPLVYKTLHHFMLGGFTKIESDAHWKHYRKMVNKSLRKDLIESYHNVFACRSLQFVDALKENKGISDLRILGILYAIDTAVETNFGFDAHTQEEKKYAMCEEILRMEKIISKVMSSPWHMAAASLIFKYYLKKSPHLIAFEEMFKEVIVEIAKKYAEKEEADDVPLGIKMFLENNKNGIPWEQTIFEMREIIMVGGVTIGNTVAMIMIFLAVYPDVQEKVWEEQNEIFDGSDRTPTAEDINKMTYLKMVVKEGIRFFAGPLLARRTSDEIVIGKYAIPKSSTIIICSHRMRMDPRYWERPNEFYPEHFLPEKVLARPKYANASFGVLPRHCPGIAYTVDAITIALSTIIRNLKLSTTLKKEDLTFTPAIFMQFECPYLISCEPR